MELQEKNTAREGESQLSAADLARAVVALPGFLPVRGMLTGGGWLCTHVCPVTRGVEHAPHGLLAFWLAPERIRFRGRREVAIHVYDGQWEPTAPGAPVTEAWMNEIARGLRLSLTDPATAGCLLSLLGEDTARMLLSIWLTSADRRPLAIACCEFALGLGRWPGGAR
jgi:hypothetical protein